MIEILDKIDSVKLIDIDVSCVICEKFIEKKISVVESKIEYKVCIECEKNLKIWKNI